MTIFLIALPRAVKSPSKNLSYMTLHNQISIPEMFSHFQVILVDIITLEN